jgi:hypothetical protein
MVPMKSRRKSRLRRGSLGVGDGSNQLFWRLRVDRGAACAYRPSVPRRARGIQAHEPKLEASLVLRLK